MSWYDTKMREIFDSLYLWSCADSVWSTTTWTCTPVNTATAVVLFHRYFNCQNSVLPQETSTLLFHTFNSFTLQPFNEMFIFDGIVAAALLLTSLYVAVDYLTNEQLPRCVKSTFSHAYCLKFLFIFVKFFLNKIKADVFVNSVGLVSLLLLLIVCQSASFTISVVVGQPTRPTQPFIISGSMDE